MATDTIAIDLVDGHVSAASAHSTLRASRLSAIVAAPVEDPGVGDLLRSNDWDRVIATLPASSAYFRFLDPPFRDRKRLSQAIGPMLEDHVPVSLDEAIPGFDAAGKETGAPILATMARRSAIESRVAELESLGLHATSLVWQPSAVIAAYRAAIDIDAPTLIVDVGIDCTVVARILPTAVAALRIVGRADDAEFEQDIRWAARTMEASADRVVVGGAAHESAIDALRRALEGVQIETLPSQCPLPDAVHADGIWRNLTSAVGLVLIATGEAAPPIIAFGTDTADAAMMSVRRTDALRALAPWGAAAAVLFSAALTIDYVRLYQTATKLDKIAERIFTTAMPGVAGGPGRRTKLELKLRELEQKRAEAAGAARPDGPLGTLATLSRNIPADLGVEFETFAYDPPNVRLRGRGASFEVVTKLQELLRESATGGAVDVGDVRSNAAGGGVDFELSIRLGEPTS